MKPGRGLRTQRAVGLYKMGLERANLYPEASGKPERARGGKPGWQSDRFIVEE